MSDIAKLSKGLHDRLPDNSECVVDSAVDTALNYIDQLSNTIKWIFFETLS